MAQYNGFTCDNCGSVISAAERTKVTVRFEGETVEGEYTKDKCPNCVEVPIGIELKPIRRRRRTTSSQQVAGGE